MSYIHCPMALKPQVNRNATGCAEQRHQPDTVSNASHYDEGYAIDCEPVSSPSFWGTLERSAMINRELRDQSQQLPYGPSTLSCPSKRLLYKACRCSIAYRDAEIPRPEEGQPVIEMSEHGETTIRKSTMVKSTKKNPFRMTGTTSS